MNSAALFLIENKKILFLIENKFKILDLFGKLYFLKPTERTGCHGVFHYTESCEKRKLKITTGN